MLLGYSSCNSGYALCTFIIALISVTQAMVVHQTVPVKLIFLVSLFLLLHAQKAHAIIIIVEEDISPINFTSPSESFCIKIFKL